MNAYWLGVIYGLDDFFFSAYSMNDGSSIKIYGVGLVERDKKFLYDCDLIL